jgi:N-succinyl-L-ornithine transcarbamylase
MKNYIDIPDKEVTTSLIKSAMNLKNDPFKDLAIGKNKRLIMLFFNASLRTRLSTQQAAEQLGMHVSILNISTAWSIEFEDGSIMNLEKAEHVKEAAQVISQYCDILAIRAFPSLTDKEKDLNEQLINGFKTHASVPIINMESATAHPLQALADALTIKEMSTKSTPKVVLTWAPHPKALPHSVANSFIKMMQQQAVDFSICHPEGYELDPNITKNTPISYNQEAALQGADFVYAKNWSSFNQYGQVIHQDSSWMLTEQKLDQAQFMHCLPIRRNVIAEDAVLDGKKSLVIQQANNRTYAAQAVIKELLLNS